jgi:predicted transcriptional regulator
MHGGVFLSVRSAFAREIVAGRKTVELRRRRPRIGAGSVALVYETSPAKRIVAWCDVDDVATHELDSLWSCYQKGAAVTRALFDAYFEGCETGHAIIFRRIHPLATPVPIEAIVDAKPLFRAPQSYRYVDLDVLAMVLGGEADWNGIGS